MVLVAFASAFPSMESASSLEQMDDLTVAESKWTSAEKKSQKNKKFAKHLAKTVG